MHEHVCNVNVKPMQTGWQECMRADHFVSDANQIAKFIFLAILSNSSLYRDFRDTRAICMSCRTDHCRSGKRPSSGAWLQWRWVSNALPHSTRPRAQCCGELVRMGHVQYQMYIAYIGTA